MQNSQGLFSVSSHSDFLILPGFIDFMSDEVVSVTFAVSLFSPSHTYRSHAGCCVMEQEGPVQTQALPLFLKHLPLFAVNVFLLIYFEGSHVCTNEEDHPEDASHFISHGYSHRVIHGHRHGSE